MHELIKLFKKSILEYIDSKDRLGPSRRSE